MLAATSQSHLIPTYFASLAPSYPPPMLGELQNQRQAFYAALQDYVQYLGKGYYLKQRHMLLQDRQNLLAQQATTAEQLELTQKEVALAGENFKVSETLSEQKVIAPVEYRTEAGKWLGKQLQLPQMKSTQLAIGGQILEKQKQLAALENEIAQQQGIFIQAVQNWLAAIAEWERQYLIYAPCDGKLVLHGFYQPGRPLQAGEIVGNVQPKGGGYFLETTLPQYNFGKLAIGQPALIRFAAYPEEEFGSIEGRLEMFKPIPTDSGYLAKLILPNGLITHLGKTLVYREGLQASVEIITDDRTVLDRMMAGLRKSIQR